MDLRRDNFMRDGVGVLLSVPEYISQHMSISFHTTWRLVPEALVSLQFLMVTIPFLYVFVSILSHKTKSQTPDAAKSPASAVFVSFPTLFDIPIRTPPPLCFEDQ